MKYQWIAKISFLTLIILAAFLAVASMVEKMYPDNSDVYSNAILFPLCIIIAVSGIAWLTINGVWRRPASLLMHLSLIIILIGAATTAIFASRGSIYVGKDAAVSSFTDDDKVTQPLPFAIQLKEFNTVCYPGTSAPMDFKADLKIDDKTYTVSLNNVVTANRYTFCLKSYIPEKDVVLLNVSNDSAGTAITYCGYLLFALSALWLLVAKHGQFRALCRRLALLPILLLCCNMTASASTIDRHKADGFAALIVEYDGRLMPFESLANSLMTKMHGSATFDNLSATQALMDMYMQTDEWGEKKFIKIKSNKVREALGIQGAYASYNDFISDSNTYKLQPYLENISTPGLRDYQDSDERFRIFQSIIEGRIFKIFPAQVTPKDVQWFSPVDRLPANVSGEQYAFIRYAFNLLTEYFISHQDKEFDKTIDKISLYQIKTAGNILPTQSQRSTEHFLNRMYAFPIHILALILGLGAWLFSLSYSLRKKIDSQTYHRSIYFVLGLITLFCLIEFILKWYVGGHIPLASGPDTMLFMALAIGVWAILSARKIKIDPSYPLLMTGFALLVAKLGNSNPAVTQLMPVLNSKWLSIHVLLVMSAYALLALIFINSLTAIIVNKRNADTVTRLTLTNKILLYPALFLLGAGIFTGAVWANISWGRYWGWDSKETWALITFIIYALPFHREIINRDNNLKFNLYLAIAFISVLITYFGVNFFLGGQHSYA